MKKKIVFLFIALVLFLWGCESTVKYSDINTSRTVLIYMNGSDLESENKLASRDLSEIIKVNNDENLNIIIETGGSKQWHTKGISSQNNQRFSIEDNKLNLIETIGSKNMGSSDTLKDFIVFSMERYMADEYILILWNHGGGAISGFAKDENFNNDTLMLNELEKSFKESFEITNEKIDLVAFDACLMSSIETANIIKDYASYMVSSEELVLGYGFNYLNILSKMTQENLDIVQVGEYFVDSYYNESVFRNKDDFVTMSLLDLSKVSSLYESFFAEISILSKNKDEFLDIDFRNSRLISFGGKSEEEGFSNMIDIKSFVTILSENGVISKDFLTSFLDILNECVIYVKNGGNIIEAGGLSVYFPLYDSGYINEELFYYSDISESESESYLSLISSYGLEVTANMDNFVNFDLSPYLGGEEIVTSFYNNKEEESIKIAFEGDFITNFLIESEKDKFYLIIPVKYKNNYGAIRLIYDKIKGELGESYLIIKKEEGALSFDKKVFPFEENEAFQPIIYLKSHNNEFTTLLLDKEYKLEDIMVIE